MDSRGAASVTDVTSVSPTPGVQRHQPDGGEEAERAVGHRAAAEDAQDQPAEEHGGTGGQPGQEPQPVLHLR